MSEIIKSAIIKNHRTRIEIATNKQVIIFEIDSSQTEQFGLDYPKLSNLEGLVINKIYLQNNFREDTLIPEIPVNDEGDDVIYEYHVKLVLETDKGKYYIIAYNSHNGYYSHSVEINFNGQTHVVTL